MSSPLHIVEFLQSLTVALCDNVRKLWRRVCCSYDSRHEIGATAILCPPLSRKQEPAKIIEQFLSVKLFSLLFFFK